MEKPKIGSGWRSLDRNEAFVVQEVFGEWIRCRSLSGRGTLFSHVNIFLKLHEPLPVAMPVDCPENGRWENGEISSGGT